LPADISKAGIKVIRVGEKGKATWPLVSTITDGSYPLSSRVYMYVSPNSTRTVKDFAKLIITSGESEQTVFRSTMSAVEKALRDNGIIPQTDTRKSYLNGQNEDN
jgi:hypothetical protein